MRIQPAGRLAFVVALLGAALQAQLSPAGTWRGPVRLADGTTVELVVTIAAGPDGALGGSVGVPAQAIEGLALSEVSAAGGEITFSVAELPGAPRFRATLAADGARLSGTMTAEQAPAPSTDIYLTQVAGGWALGQIRNLTDREGYDSQPAFLPDGSALLYASQREGQTDIYRYDLESGARRRVTSTAEAEYSPTPMADGVSFSSVRVEADGTQRLWRFPLAGGEPQLLLPAVAPVGYHAWFDADTLALFVLGEPPRLEIARLASGEARAVAENPGRSLHAVPGRPGAVSFVEKTSEEGPWPLAVYETATGSITRLGTILPGSEDYVWTAAGELLMGSGSKLSVGTVGADGIAWREIADLASAGVAGISRLALSPDGRWLAIVGETPAPPPATVEAPFELVRVP